jgi:hypothetical protein
MNGFSLVFMDQIGMPIGVDCGMSYLGSITGGRHLGAWGGGGGYFNVIRFQTERLGIEAYTQAMLDFSYCVSAHGFIDTPLMGGQLMREQNIYFIFIFNFRVDCMFILSLSI